MSIGKMALLFDRIKKSSLGFSRSFEQSSISHCHSLLSSFCLYLSFSSIAEGHPILALAQNGTDLTQIWGMSRVCRVCKCVSDAGIEEARRRCVGTRQTQTARTDTVWHYWPVECISGTTESSWATWLTGSGLRKGSWGRPALFSSTCYLTEM